MKNVTIDGKIVDLKSVDFDGIDHNDAPDYSDAFIVSAEFEDGTPLIEAQLEELFDLCGYDLLMDFIHWKTPPHFEKNLGGFCGGGGGGW